MIEKPYIWLYWDNYPNQKTPTYIEMCWESVRRHCGKDFRIIVINSDTVKQYLPGIREDFFQMAQINNKSNYLRYKLLFEHGGIWLDSDMIILHNLLPLLDHLEEVDLVATASPQYKYGEPESGFIISRKNGQVISKALTIIDKKIDAVPTGHIFQWGTMGPAVLRQAVKGEKYIHLNPKVLMPIGWQEAFRFDRIDRLENYLTKDTLAIMLFNEMFRRSKSRIMTMTRQELLDSKWLIGQVFRKAFL